MLTKEQIREDLEDIRVYYSIKSVFDKAPAEIKAEALLEKLEQYHSVMRKAPAKLYVLYISLYVENNSQTALSEEWNFTKDYIKDLNKQLVEYLHGSFFEF